jgi:hypothetical protein
MTGLAPRDAGLSSAFPFWIATNLRNCQERSAKVLPLRFNGLRRQSWTFEL